MTWWLAKYENEADENDFGSCGAKEWKVAKEYLADELIFHDNLESDEAVMVLDEATEGTQFPDLKVGKYHFSLTMEQA